MRWTLSGAVRGADGETGKTEEGVTGGHNLRSAAFAALCQILWHGPCAAAAVSWLHQSPLARPAGMKPKPANA